MNYQVIARKWRPQTFADVVGQQHATRTLQNAIRTNRVAHAYIFSGVRGVGKTSSARILAKALNCAKGPAPEPCNQCDRCREISAGTSLDVIEIDAASNRGIDQIRELREMVRYAPATGRYKVVILDEAHQLTEEASNALLKTLEEPPERVIFILATTAPDELSETIRSRAQHFHFRSLSFNEIAESLEQVTKAEGLEIEPGAVAVLARAAEGSLRDGLSLLEQAMAYCDKSITDREVRELLGIVSEEALDEMIEAAAAASAERALSLVHRIIASGENLDSFCREAIRHVRNLLVVRVAGADSPMVAASADERPRLERQAALFSEEDLTRFFNLLLATQSDLRRHPDPRLHMEMGMLRIVNAARLVPLEELLAELGGQARLGGEHGPAPVAPPAAAVPSRNPSSGPGPHLSRFSSAEALPERGRPSASEPGPQASVATPSRHQNSSAGAGFKPAPAMPNLSASSAPGAASPADTAAQVEARATEPDGASGTSVAQASARAPDAATSPAPDETEPAPATPAEPSPPASGAAGDLPETSGIDPAEVQALIAAVLAQQKFLASLLTHVTKWEVSGGELHIYFPPEQRSLSEMLQSREPMEKLRTIANQVLGRPLRVCVKLGSSRSAAAPADRVPAKNSGSEAGSARDLRARFEQDPKVKAMLGRFGGRISRVKPAGGS
jgi:DNA polymerase-3 subunit gamma/tau